MPVCLEFFCGESAITIGVDCIELLPRAASCNELFQTDLTACESREGGIWVFDDCVRLLSDCAL